MAAKPKQVIDPRFAERMFVHSQTRVPKYSRDHGQVPKLYVQEWKTDMKNRELIIKNAELGGVPHFEHDENLFLDRREQMTYNVEDGNRVDRKCRMPDRAHLLRPPFHHETSRYQSELMFRRDV
ncbi:TEX43-like protein [Mya arenaria]|uniref:TEX43-like protein n=1 Tax=Mya arenaria TaxID=6604 RepID=A0ABY7FJ40_MYAAR|nr:testis-expressed protein 43-like [Mya arenaria]WAR19271.1 TEX43-like protein [Mya arenaria]